MSNLAPKKPATSSDVQKRKLKKTIKVHLAQQILEAYEGDQRIFRFECVTGDKNHPTERGIFVIRDRHENYTSKSYEVPMDFAMFFTPDGKAIHKYHGFMPLPLLRTAKAVSDQIGSHGCVRLSDADARALFKWTPRLTEVHVL